MGLGSALTDLRAWAARRIAPKPPPAPPPPPPATPPAPPPVVASAAGRGLTPWGRPAKPSPAEQARRKAAADQLEAQLATTGAAGWASDHAEEANQCSGWVYVGTDVCAKRVASAEAEVHEQDPRVPNEEGRRPVRPDHPLAALLRRPNPKYDLWGLLYRVEQQLCLTGTALVWAPKNGLGLPGRLWVLPTALARPQPPSAEFPEGSYLVSVISLTQWAFFGASFWNTPAGAPVQIDARDVVRVTYPHPLTEADGLSPVWATGQAIDVARETDEALWAILSQGPMPSYVFAVDPSVPITDEDQATQVAETIEARLAGARNAGKVAVVSAGTLSQATFSPADVIPGDLRNQNRDNVLAANGVPAVAAGVAGATAYSGLYAALQQLDTGRVEPDLQLIAGALTLHLAGRFGDRLVVVLKLKPLNDPDLKLRTAQQKKDSACYTVNELRSLFGDSPLTGANAAYGEQIVGKPPEPAPAAPGLPGDPTDTEGDGPDADGPGLADPARRAAPVEDLHQFEVRAKALGWTLPPPPWKGGRR